MYISRLSLKNIRCFTEAELNFSSPDDVNGGCNIILGPNMAGKTTLFESIIRSFLGDSKIVSWLHPHDIGGYANISKRMTTLDEPPCIETDFVLNQKKFRNSFVFEMINDQNSWRQSNQIIQEIDPAKTRPLPLIIYYSVQDHFFADWPSVEAVNSSGNDIKNFNPFENVFSEKKFQQTFHLLAKYSYFFNPHEDAFSSGGSFDYNSSPFPIQLLKEKIKKYFNVSIFEGGVSHTSGQTNYRKDAVIRVGKNNIPVHRPGISRGLLSSLAIIFDTFVRLSLSPDKLNSKCIILIDEASIFLHPTWQVKYISLLKELFPAAQIIMSTHSPFLISGDSSAKLFKIYRDDENNSEVEDITDNPSRYSIDNMCSLFEVSRKSSFYDQLEKELKSILYDAHDSGDPRLVRLLTQLSIINSKYRDFIVQNEDKKTEVDIRMLKTMYLRL